MVVSSESAATVELDEKFIVALASAVDVDAVGVVAVTRRVDEAVECSVEPDEYFHEVVLALGLNICFFFFLMHFFFWKSGTIC